MRPSRHLLGAIAGAAVAIGLAWFLRLAVEPKPNTGPLAIVEPQIGTSDALALGKLVVRDDCVLLDQPSGDRVLVIWLRGSVTWNAGDMSFAVRGPDGEDVTLRDGGDLALTGAGGPIADIEAAGSWVARPAASCTAPEWFLAVEARLSPSS
jgi:hypothetical protein